MKKILKFTGITLLIILILIIILPFIFKDKIIEKVKSEVNNTLNAKVNWGEVDLTLFRSFPNFSLGIEKLQVVGVDNFKDDTLVTAEKIFVTIDLFSVIKGDNYKIEGITLTKPNILAIIDKDGKANWDITKPSETPLDTATKDNEPSNFKLSLKKLKIDDANIRFIDRQGNMSAELLNLNHTLSGDLTASTTDIRTITNVKEITFIMDGISYLKKGKADIKFDVNADLDKMKFEFLDNNVKINELELNFTGFFQMLENSYNMDMKIKTPNTEFKNVLSMIPAIYMKDFEKIKTTGSFELSAYAKGTYDSLNLPAFDIDLAIKNASFKYSDLPKSVNNIQIATNIKNKGGSANNTIINVKKCHLEMANNPFDLTLYVSTPISDPNMDITAKGKIDLAVVKDFYPLEKDQKLSGLLNADIAFAGRMSHIDNKQYEKFKALGKIELKNVYYADKDLPKGVRVSEAAMIFSPAFAELTNLNLKIEDNDFSAKGKVENFIGYMFDRGELVANLSTYSNHFNANDFLNDQPSSTPSNQPKTESTSEITAFDVPKNINFTMKSQFKYLKYDKLDIHNLLGIIIIKDQKVTLQNLNMNVLDGEVKMNGYYSSQNPKPDVNINFNLNNLDIQKSWKYLDIMKKVAPIAEKSIGRFSTSFNITTLLDNTMTPIWESIQAAGLLKTASVKIYGSEIFNKISKATKIEALKEFNLKNLFVDFEIQDGKIFTKPFDIKIDQLTSKVSGKTGIDQTIDYLFKMEVPRKVFGNVGNEFVNNMTGKIAQTGVKIKPTDIIKFDVKVGGTFKNPIIKTGLKDLTSNAIEDVKDAVKDEIEKKKDEVIKDVKKEVNKALEDAQKQADAIMADAQKQADKLKAEAKNAGDKIIEEADKQGKKLIAEAKNPILKIAAEKTAKKLNQEAADKAKKLNQEADSKAKQILDNAKAKSDKIIKDAQNKAK